MQGPVHCDYIDFFKAKTTYNFYSSIWANNKVFQPDTRIRKYVSLIAEDIRRLQQQEQTEQAFKFNEAYGEAARQCSVRLRILIMM